jgi:hypothetical protein
MNNIFRFLFTVFCLSTSLHPIYAQWIQVKAGISVSALAVSGTNIFAGTDGGVYLSTNKGTSWTSAGLSNNWIWSFAVSGTNIFAGLAGGGIFLSTNNGKKWTSLSDSMVGSILYVSALAVSGTNLFAGTVAGVYRSSDNGTNWTTANTGLNSNVYAFAVSGTNIFAGANDIVYRSTNNGGTWIKGGAMDPMVRSIAIYNTNLFAGTNGTGVFYSTNDSKNWVQVNSGLTNLNVYSLAISGTNIFAGLAENGVFLSTNNGTKWTSTGLTTNADANALAICDSNLFVGLWDGSGIWKRPLSEIVTSVDGISNNLPSKLILYQNYPNPFNPATTISFSLPFKSFVSLKIFDITGREVATLLSEVLSAGNHTRRWNAEGLPSSVYLYRLQAGSFTGTKKLVLLR